MRILKLQGISVDLDRINNPKLRRITRNREDDFLFNYGDGYHDSGKSHRSRGGHTDHHLHEDEVKHYYGDYSESGTHTDTSKRGSSRGSSSKHRDYTDEHEDLHWDDKYNDYWAGD